MADTAMRAGLDSMTEVTRRELSRLLKLHGQRVMDGKENSVTLRRDHNVGSRMSSRILGWVAKYGLADPMDYPDKPQTDVHDWGSKSPPGIEDAPTSPTAEFTDIDPNHISVDVRAQALVMSVEDLVRVSGLDLKTWRIVKHEVNTWTTAMKIEKIAASRKNGDPVIMTEPSVVRNWQVKVWCQRRFDKEVRLPKFSVPIRTELPQPRGDGRKVALLIPDAQIGFRRHRSDLYPLHDRRALDAALRVAKLLQPDEIIFLGDNVDFAELSEKYPVPAAMIDTAEPALAETRFWVASFQEAAPEAQLTVLDGNHENRARMKGIKHLAGLAEARAPGETRSALDIGRLLGLDALGVNHVSPYGTDYWLWDRVRITHGDIVRAKSGQTVASIVSEADHSTAFGHIHRVEVAYRTQWGPGGSRQIFAASPGCMCRIAPGIVPGVKVYQNWQQGIGIVSMDLETGQESITLPLIDRGRLWLEGGLIEGSDQTARVEKETGWRMAGDWLLEGE